MYRRILLSSDDSREGLSALREGAVMAQAFGAKVFLLIVDYSGSGVFVAEGSYPMTHEDPRPLLEFGLQRLARLGIEAQGKAVTGEPVLEIASHAKWFEADLIVLGHRRQTLLERWWAGSSGAYVADRVSCSVLLARNVVSDADLRIEPAGPAAARDKPGVGKGTPGDARAGLTPAKDTVPRRGLQSTGGPRLPAMGGGESSPRRGSPVERLMALGRPPFRVRRVPN